MWENVGESRDIKEIHELEMRESCRKQRYKGDLWARYKRM